MASSLALKQMILNGEWDEKLILLYGEKAIMFQRERYIKAIEAFEGLFGKDREIALFSAPGRTEVGGNHTDHNHGRVLAASINLDVLAVASKSDNETINLKSEGFDIDIVSLSSLLPLEEETGKSPSLIRGLCARFHEVGYKIGGFDAYTTSNVLKGSGLSSSAAFEVLVGNILSHFFNDGSLNPVFIAQASQYAENVYFGKPSGLMDQMASSVGGFVAIDFQNPKEPIINKVDFNFKASEHSLCIVDTGGNHADLTDEYAAVRLEMDGVAKALGKPYMREVKFDEFEQKLPMLREKLGDRAVLRALHFIGDNERVLKQTNALKNGNFEAFLSLVTESGRSSFMYNQNVFTGKNVEEQGLSIALAITERILEGKGAFRVHGGGFAGTIQAFVPNDLLDVYKEKIENIFGKGSCYVLFVRPVGAVKL